LRGGRRAVLVLGQARAKAKKKAMLFFTLLLLS
jgi:hypothetical protein